MRVLVVGSEGQLGTELLEVFGQNAVGCGRQEVDISSADSISYQLDHSTFDCVINAAAYNKVDLAEEEPEIAYLVNSLGPRNLAQECAKRGICLVHVSSDYVFGLEDSQRAWIETDAPGPVSAYGTSKLSGEYFVRSLCTRHFVVRTCGLYGKAARSGRGKGNFVETMLRLGAEREVLRIVDDQHCTPTSAKDLAAAIHDLVQTSAFGLYHATNREACTWARFAEEIFAYAGVKAKVERIPSAEYPTKARRPSYSVLNCSKLEATIGQPLRTWKTALHQYLDERSV